MTADGEFYVEMDDVRFRCPSCGNEDRSQMLSFSRQWIALSDLRSPEDIEPQAPDERDECLCTATRGKTMCGHRAALLKFILAANGPRKAAKPESVPEPVYEAPEVEAEPEPEEAETGEYMLFESDDE